MRKGATIRDVAKAAGVGVGTVSRVINGVPVSDKTRAAVEKAIEELGYIPNSSARKLAGGKTGWIMMFTPEIRTEFHWRLIKSFDSFLEQKDYQTIIYPLISMKRLEQIQKSKIMTYEADGLVLCTTKLGKILADSKGLKVPLVLVEGQDRNHDSIYLDNFLGGVLAARTLIEDQAITYCAVLAREQSPLLSNENVDLRFHGYKNELEKNGISIKEENIVIGDFFLGPSQEQIMKILTKNNKPGIFAITDNFALAVLEVARTLGMIAGKDYYLIGYDNQTWTERAELTTISQPIEDMGRSAAELMLKRIEDPGCPFQHLKFIPSVIRRSTA